MTTETTITPPLKWHGGKAYLAKRIIELMPPSSAKTKPRKTERVWMNYEATR